MLGVDMTDGSNLSHQTKIGIDSLNGVEFINLKGKVNILKMKLAIQFLNTHPNQPQQWRS